MPADRPSNDDRASHLTPTDETAGAGTQPDEVDLVAYVLVLWRRRAAVLVSALVCGLLALIYSALQPSAYLASATILPQPDSASGRVSSQVLLPKIVASLPGMSSSLLTPNRDLYVSILKSRAIAERLVERFHLAPTKRSPDVARTIRQLRESTTIAVSKEGVISITVEWGVPDLAADLANAHLEVLNSMLTEFGVTAASRQKEFIAERLATTDKELAAAEEDLRAFEEKHPTVSLPDMSIAETIARLKAEIVTDEIELQTVRLIVPEGNAHVVQLRASIEAMRQKVHELETGEIGSSVVNDSDPLPSGGRGEPVVSTGRDFVTLRELSKLKLDSRRLTRRVVVHETVHQILTQQMEEAKIEEARESPTIQSLDRAVAPLGRSRPRVQVAAMVGAIAGLFAGLVLAFILEYVERVAPRAYSRLRLPTLRLPGRARARREAVATTTATPPASGKKTPSPASTSQSRSPGSSGADSESGRKESGSSGPERAPTPEDPTRDDLSQGDASQGDASLLADAARAAAAGETGESDGRKRRRSRRRRRSRETS